MPQCRQGRSCVRCFQAAIARWHMLIRRSRTTLTQLIRRVGTLSSCAWRLAETTVNDMVVMKRAPADLPRRSSVDTLNSRRSSGIIGVDRGSALPVCCTSVACCPRKRCVRAAETCSHNISLVAGAVAQVQLSVDALKLARSPLPPSETRYGPLRNWDGSSYVPKTSSDAVVGKAVDDDLRRDQPNCPAARENNAMVPPRKGRWDCAAPGRSDLRLLMI